MTVVIVIIIFVIIGIIVQVGSKMVEAGYNPSKLFEKGKDLKKPKDAPSEKKGEDGQIKSPSVTFLRTLAGIFLSVFVAFAGFNCMRTGFVYAGPLSRNIFLVILGANIIVFFLIWRADKKKDS